MAFAIPQLMKKDGQDETLLARLKGKEPDVCVAVIRKGGPADQTPRIYATR